MADGEAAPVCILLFGPDDADHLSLTPGPVVGDVSDPYGAQRDTLVSIQAGPFRGAFRTAIHPSAMQKFLAEVRDLHSRLTGTATLATIEDTISVTLTGNGRGGIAVAGTLQDGIHHGCRLCFAFDIDQTFLAPVLIAARALRDG